MATLALQQGGAAIGGAFGGPAGASFGGLVGGFAGQLLFRPKPEERFGPRLGDDSVTDATEGLDIPIVWGRDRLAGTIIWQGPRNEQEYTEDIGGKGGPTATQTTYTYRRSFAVDFGEFESDAILRIWLNKVLVYDVRPEAVGIRKQGLAFQIYLGTETQDPDPIIESYVGTGNVSAYRGHTYILFNEYDVTQLGGRPPTVEAEVLTAATASTQSLTLDVAPTSKDTMSGFHWDAYNRRIYACFSGLLAAPAIVAVADPFGRSLVQVLEQTDGNRGACIPFTSIDSFEFNAGRNDRLFVYSKDQVEVFDTANLKPIGSFNPGGDPMQWLVETRNMLAFTYANVFTAWSKASSVAAPVAASFNAQTLPTGYTNEPIQYGFSDNFDLIKIMRKTATSEYAACRFTPSTTGGSAGTVYDWGELIADWSEIYGIAEDTVNGWVWALAADTSSIDHLFKISLDGELLEIITLGTLATYDETYGENPLFFDALTRSLYIHLNTTTIYIYDVVTGTQTQKTVTHGGNGAIFLPDLQEIWSGSFNDGGETKLYGDAIDRITSTDVTYASIITDICALAGIPAASLNTALVTDTTPGYRHSRRVPARADLEPLLTAGHIDVVQSDYKLKFVPRGGSIAATIDSDLLGAHRQGTTPVPALRHIYAQGVDYPSSVDLHYRSVESDLQHGLARAAWYTNDSEHQETLTIPMVMSDDEAVELADVYLQLLVEKDRFEWATPRYYAALEPTDCVNLTVNAETVRVRITDVTRGADGLHQWKGELDDVSDLTSYAVSGGVGVESSEVELFSPPQLIVIDGPLLRDVDNDHPGPYVAGFTRSTGFPGAALYVSADGANYIQTNSVTSESDVGTISTVPVEVILDGWDDTNSLSTEMITGTLSTITDAEVLAGGNAMLWGVPGRWEVIQPATCTFVSGTTYTLTHILRGRRGTDWAMGLHSANDWLIVADDQTLRRMILANQDIDSQRWLKLPAIGSIPADANASLITVSDVALKPYSAIELEGTFDGTGCTLDWLRRTRKGGAYGGNNGFVDGVGGNISEDSESWECDVFDVADTDTVLRTLTASTNSVLYAIADMTTDGISSGGPLYAKLYQISAVAGRGYPREEFLADSLYDAIEGGSPVIYWHLDETSGTTATDAMGNHDGTISGPPTLEKTGLVSTGTCFGFDAIGEQVVSPNTSDFLMGDTWTVLFWVSPSAAASGRRIFKLENGPDRILIDYSTSNEVLAYVRDSDGFLRGPITSSVLTAGTPYSVILTYDGSTLRLYIDGVEDITGSIPAGTDWGTSNPKITLANTACGDIDEMAVYARTLGQIEIDGIVALGGQIVQVGLVSETDSALSMTPA